MKKFLENRKHGEETFPIGIYDVILDEKERFISFHNHKEIEILYIELGECDIQINSKSYKLKKDDIFIINSYDLHYFNLGKSRECIWKSIVFDLNIINNSNIDKCYINFLSPIINREIYIKEKFDIENENYFEIKDYILNLLSENDNKEIAYELKIKSNLLNLFACIFRNNDFFENKSKKNYKQIENIRKVINYIENNYENEISIENLASICYYNKDYFMRTFKKYTNFSATNYIKNLRLEKSYYLVTNSSKNITEVCFEVGFSNVSYFIKSFKEKYSKTPNEIRNSDLNTKVDLLHKQ